MLKLLKKINLGDKYEFQARIVPAMIVVIPVVSLVLQFEYAHKSWLRAIGIGGGLDVFLAVVFGKVAHMMGRRLEDGLVKKWGGLPTHRWLRPSDPTHSEQQKSIWRTSLKKLSKIDIDIAMAANNPDEIDRVIGDAVLNTRNSIRGSRDATMLDKANIAYGFARNLAGIRMIGLGLSGGACAIAAWCVFASKLPLSSLLIQSLFLAASIAFLLFGSTYVKHCSERYAESFFVAAVKIADKKK